MLRKRHTTKANIGKLRDTEVLVGRSGSIGKAIRGRLLASLYLAITEGEQ